MAFHETPAWWAGTQGSEAIWRTNRGDSSDATSKSPLCLPPEIFPKEADKKNDNMLYTCYSVII